MMQRTLAAAALLVMLAAAVAPATYLQLIVMRETKMLEKRLPGVEIEWRQLTSGPVIRDAMVAGQMDVGSGGVGPFVQAIDKGLDWKTLGALTIRTASR
jgi:ABC-type nitrate/sulfonate/bicarbonate transport system substrate-binding protein